MKKNLSETKPCYSEQILPVPWPFVLMGFHCSRIYGVLKHTLYAHCYFFSGYLLQLTFYGILAFLGFMLQALTMSPVMPAQRVHRQITVSTEYKCDSPSCCKVNEVENIFLTHRTQSWSVGSSVQRFIRSYGDSKFNLFCCHPPLYLMYPTSTSRPCDHVAHANSPGLSGSLLVSSMGHQISQVKLSYKIFCALIWNLSIFSQNLNLLWFIVRFLEHFCTYFITDKDYFSIFTITCKSKLWWSVTDVRLHHYNVLSHSHGI